MGIHSASPRSPERKLISIAAFMEEYSQGKSTTFLLLSRGEIEAVKCGRRTFIVAESAERWRASLPKAR